MKNYIRIFLLFEVFILTIMLCSCGNKKTDDEKAFEKAQTEYNKGGLDAFSKFVSKNKYFPVIDNTQDNATPFLIVLKNGDIENCKLFFEKGASYIEKDGSGCDCLDYAIKANNISTFNYVLSILPQSYWNIPDNDGNLPFIKIITQCNDYEIVKHAIDNTNNINNINKSGKTSLMYAAQCNVDVRTVKYLLDKGAELNIKNNNEWTALMYSARYNPNPAVMEDLILRGADLVPNSVGLTITMLGSCNPNTGVLLTLFNYINEVNSQTDKGKTALMYACENQQDSSVIKLLIEKGANVNEKDKDGKTALMYALEKYNKPEVAYILIAADAKTDDEDFNKKTIREYLTSNTILSSSDLLNALDVKQKTPEKQTLINEEEVRTDSSEMISSENVITASNNEE